MSTGGSYVNPHVYDTTLTTCDFRSGAKAHIFVSWLHPFKEQKLVIVGGKKMVVFDDVDVGCEHAAVVARARAANNALRRRRRGISMSHSLERAGRSSG